MLRHYGGLPPLSNRGALVWTACLGLLVVAIVTQTGWLFFLPPVGVCVLTVAWMCVWPRWMYSSFAESLGEEWERLDEEWENLDEV